MDSFVILVARDALLSKEIKSVLIKREREPFLFRTNDLGNMSMSANV